MMMFIMVCSDNTLSLCCVAMLIWLQSVSPAYNHTTGQPYSPDLARRKINMRPT